MSGNVASVVLASLSVAIVTPSARAVAGPNPAAADGQVLQVGSARAVAGTRARGTLVAGEHADGSPFALPVQIVAGRRPGPTVWINALTHGDEYGGARALQDVMRGLDPEAMTGQVVAVLAANPPAFQALQRVNPNLDDLADLGRSFPGRADLFATDRLAATIFENVRRHANYFIDLHTGGDRFRQLPFVLYTPNAAVPDALYDDLARAFGVPTLWRDAVPVFKGSAVTPLSAGGLPSFLLEVGGGHPLRDDDLRLQADAVRSFLRRVGVVAGSPTRRSAYTVVGGYRVATNARGGFLQPVVKPGDRVAEGDVLGTVLDTYGDTVETIRAPAGSELVLGVITYPAWATGGWLFELGSGVREEREP
jgi:predicted deacylase